MTLPEISAFLLPSYAYRLNDYLAFRVEYQGAVGPKNTEYGEFFFNHCLQISFNLTY
jgi:hypothetical protein